VSGKQKNTPTGKVGAAVKLGAGRRHFMKESVVSLHCRDGIDWSINQPVTYPPTPTIATEMPIRVLTTAELLGYRASTPVLNIFADMQHLFPDSDFVRHGS